MRKKKEKDPRGGAREGAGRKRLDPTGVRLDHATFSISAETARRIKALREATKNDDLPFNRMFEKWVEELAEAYGIE